VTDVIIWRGGEEYVLGWAAVQTHSLHTVQVFLHRFRGDAEAMSALRHFLMERSPLIEVHKRSDEEVLDAVAHLLASGEAVMSIESSIGHGALQEAEEASGANRQRPAPPPPEPAGPPREVKTWVEFEVVDEANNPVGGKRYKVMLPDGRIHEGALDKTGKLRFSNIDPGTCVFSLTDVDAESWRKA
jgi:hypothetical protein